MSKASPDEFSTISLGMVCTYSVQGASPLALGEEEISIIKRL
jgi:hypothetical protein